MDNIIAQMIQQASANLNHAYAPYSHFQVSCCIQTPNSTSIMVSM